VSAGLELSGLRLVERGGAPLVEVAELRVAPGESLGIVGESGSGKSLLLRSLIGLLPDGVRRAAGEVRLDGAPVHGHADVRGQIGLVLQDPGSALDPVRRVGAQIADVRRAVRGLPRAVAASDAVALLDRVGIRDAAATARLYPHELSGGMRQRAAIAVALAAEPRFLLCDEPTTALDVTVQQRVLDLLSSLRAEGLGLVFVSHDLPVVAQVSERIMVMRHGQVIESGVTDEVIAAPASDYFSELIAEARALEGGSDG
jgi:peptide/nickel transport system ATP-binding protein